LAMASWKSIIGQTVYPGHESEPAAGVGEGAGEVGVCAETGATNPQETITVIAAG
jgi:hypothetical protein